MTTQHIVGGATRRNAFLGTAALALTGMAAAPPPNPDTALIVLCASYVAKMREYCAVGRHTHELLLSNPEWIRCHEISCALIPGLHAMEAEIAATPARTVAGLLAKAEAARHVMAGDADQEDRPMDDENALAWSLVVETLDVLGRA